MKLVATWAVALLLCGCHASGEKASAEKPAASADKAAPSGDKASPSSDRAEESSEGVALKPEEVEKLGIQTTPAQQITSAPEASGFAVVLAHETIAQALAELRTATAAARQSRAALARVKRLAGTPGAMPAETVEGAEEKAAADQATLDLARQRLSSTFGQNPRWAHGEITPELRALSSGQKKLVRVTFPLGAVGAELPAEVRLAHLGASQAGQSWLARGVWSAPADATVPGRSFFAVVASGEASEGEHLMAWVPVGAPEPGVLIPAAAAVMSQGQFWCYIEKKPGTFVRTGFDASRSTAEGYFVREGVSPGERIVTTAAGQLLARETNPSTEPE
jgi:hypothetical protein